MERMSMPRNLKIEVNNAVFSLPYHVAQDKGFFRDEGLDVELIPAGSGRDRDKEVAEQPIEDHKERDPMAGTKG